MGEEYLLIQALGAIGFIISMVIAPQCKHGKAILIAEIPSAALWGFHYLLLGGVGGAVMCFVSVIRTVISFAIDVKYVPYIIACGVAIGSVITSFYWQGLFDIVPILGGILFGASFLNKDNSLHVRNCNILSTLCYFVYNVYFLSPIGIASNATALVLQIIGLYRNDWDEFLGFIHQANITVKSYAHSVLHPHPLKPVRSRIPHHK